MECFGKKIIGDRHYLPSQSDARKLCVWHQLAFEATILAIVHTNKGSKGARKSVQGYLLEGHGDIDKEVFNNRLKFKSGSHGSFLGLVWCLIDKIRPCCYVRNLRIIAYVCLCF